MVLRGWMSGLVGWYSRHQSGEGGGRPIIQVGVRDSLNRTLTQIQMDSS